MTTYARATEFVSKVNDMWPGAIVDFKTDRIVVTVKNKVDWPSVRLDQIGELAKWYGTNSLRFTQNYSDAAGYSATLELSP